MYQYQIKNKCINTKYKIPCSNTKYLLPCINTKFVTLKLYFVKNMKIKNTQFVKKNFNCLLPSNSNYADSTDLIETEQPIYKL